MSCDHSGHTGRQEGNSTLYLKYFESGSLALMQFAINLENLAV